MDLQNLLSHVDHTLLNPTAAWPQIQEVVNDGIHFHTASVCIPPRFVEQAADYAKGKVPICTVIGFPNGYSSTLVKCYEAADAVGAGADEIDMVIALGMVKEKDYDGVLQDIQAVKRACAGRLLKVIVETCLLTQEEKIEMCRVVSQSGADFIKTSTGFSTGGATFSDVALMREHCDPALRIKAAGGISSLEDGEKFLQLGASRLGTSRIVKLAKEREETT